MEDSNVKLPPQFIPKLRGQKILIRLLDGRPLNMVLEAYNNYELLFDCGRNKKMLVFKHAITSIEYENKEK